MKRKSRVERAVLPNGLTVVVERMPYLPSVTAGLWIKRGSRHETDSTRGGSHIVEHMVFKGTPTRSYGDISRTFDRMGGALDAFTSREIMGFYFGVMKHNFEEAFEVMADMLINPAFPEDELERERAVILEEIGMLNDSPVDILADRFMERAFPRNALGLPIAGTAQSVRGITRARLRRHFNSLMRPGNLVVTATGDTSLGEVLKSVEGTFGKLKAGISPPPKPPRFSPGTEVFGKRNLEQAQIVLGFSSEPAGSPSRHVLSVLANALGGTMSSRLFTEIREKRGFVYSINAEHSGFTDAGLFIINAAASHAKARRTVSETVRVLRNILEEGFSEEEISIAKENLIGGQILGMESPAARMGLLIRNEVFFGCQKDPMKYLDTVKRVTSLQVRSLARKVFRRDSALLCILGRRSSLAGDVLAELEWGA